MIGQDRPALDESWESWFSPIVLSRGYRYFEDDRVVRLKPVVDGWSATVDGSEAYEVFVGREFESSFCECPYFIDRGPCKHIAATCYTIESEARFALPQGAPGAQPAQAEPAASHRKVDPYELARSLDDATRLDYLLAILRADAGWREDIARRFGDIDEVRLKHEFVEEVWSIVRANSRRGFVDYRSAFRCEIELSGYVRSFLDTLIERGAYEAAFHITTTFALCLQKIAIDDSDGFFTTMVDLCSEYWERIAGAGGGALGREVLGWLADFVENADEADDENGALWCIEEAAEKLVIGRFATDTAFARDVEALADRIIAGEVAGGVPGIENPHPGVYLIPHRLVTWTGAKVRCMVTLGRPRAEIEQVVLDAPALLDIVQPLVDQARKSGDSETAIRLLRQFQERNATGRFSTDASLQLLKLYDGAGRREDAERELHALAVKGRAVNDDQLKSWFRKLEKHAGERWPERLRQLEADLAGDQRRLRMLLAETGQLEKLMSSLEESGSRYALDQYRDILGQRFPEKYLGAYERQVREALFGHAMQRQAYREQVYLMMRMRDLPGGDEVVSRIVGELREAYPRRRALMEELDRLAE